MWILLFSITRQLSASTMLRLLAFGCGMGQVEFYQVFNAGYINNERVIIIKAKLVMEIEMTRYGFQSGDFQVMVF
jgi:hypothetical protein